MKNTKGRCVDVRDTVCCIATAWYFVHCNWKCFRFSTSGSAHAFARYPNTNESVTVNRNDILPVNNTSVRFSNVACRTRKNKTRKKRRRLFPQRFVLYESVQTIYRNRLYPSGPEATCLNAIVEHIPFSWTPIDQQRTVYTWRVRDSTYESAANSCFREENNTIITLNLAHVVHNIRQTLVPAGPFPKSFSTAFFKS